MPNYAWNEMNMKVSDYKKYVLNPENDADRAVDFNILLPMPKVYESYDSGTDSDRASVYYISDRMTLTSDETITKIRELLPNDYAWNYAGYKIAYDSINRFAIEDTDAAYELGKQIAENIKNYGSKDWYEWCCTNWGTKWNAFDCEEDYIDEEDDFCSIRFTTAWGAPHEWLIELSKYCDFELTCDVEGSDTRYRYVCENGKLRYFESDFVEKELKI